MPCNSDYLEASRFEAECQIMAKLIIYAESFYKGITPKWIKECSQNYYGAPNDGQGGDKRLAPYLCNLITKMSHNTRQQIVYNAMDKKSRDLADWWEEHQDADKKRISEEKSTKTEEKIKRKALAKLTKQEKEILGLTN